MSGTTKNRGASSITRGAAPPHREITTRTGHRSLTVWVSRPLLMVGCVSKTYRPQCSPTLLSSLISIKSVRAQTWKNSRFWHISKAMSSRKNMQSISAAQLTRCNSCGWSKSLTACISVRCKTSLSTWSQSASETLPSPWANATTQTTISDRKRCYAWWPSACRLNPSSWATRTIWRRLRRPALLPATQASRTVKRAR